MLDIEYPTLQAFIADCRRCGCFYSHLLATGKYARVHGWIVSVHYL